MDWQTLQEMHVKIDNLTPFTQRDKVIFGAFKTLIMEHAVLLDRYEKLKKRKKINAKRKEGGRDTGQQHIQKGNTARATGERKNGRHR